MLNFVWCHHALTAEFSKHLLLSHLPVDEAAVEGLEFEEVLEQLQGDFVVEGLVSRLLVLLSDAGDKKEVLEAHLGAFLETVEAVV